MPTYEYECRQCGHRFEQQQAMTDAPLKACPECKGEIRRIVSGGTGFINKLRQPRPYGRMLSGADRQDLLRTRGALR